MKLHRETITFLGHDLTIDGLKLSALKIEAIENFATPTDEPAFQRLIVFANYLARFCPQFSDVVLPLRDLLKSENEFRWDERLTFAFDKLKETLKTAPVLQYFDEKKEILVGLMPVNRVWVLFYFRTTRSSNLRAVPSLQLRLILPRSKKKH